jgi:hypothetical protein
VNSRPWLFPSLCCGSRSADGGGVLAATARVLFFQRLLAEKHSALVRGAKLLLEKEVMSGADLKDIMAAH